jgi:hypothetical protein
MHKALEERTMSRAMPAKWLTAFMSVVAFGIALAMAGASAANPTVRVSPSFGHPVWLDLRDQLRYPAIQGQILTDNPNAPSQSGGHTGGHNVPHWTSRPKH